MLQDLAVARHVQLVVSYSTLQLHHINMILHPTVAFVEAGHIAPLGQRNVLSVRLAHLY